MVITTLEKCQRIKPKIITTDKLSVYKGSNNIMMWTSQDNLAIYNLLVEIRDELRKLNSK